MLKVFLPEQSEADINWIDGAKLVGTIEEADAVLVTGGADIDPSLYGQKEHPLTSTYSYRDKRDWWLMENAEKQGKIILGICRGLQAITVFAGGNLIQHVTGHGDSNHKTRIIPTGDDISITTCHHQMCFPYPAQNKGWEVTILGCSNPAMSLRYEGEDRENRIKEMETIEIDGKTMILEPEIIEFRKGKMRMWGIQGHPEWSDDRHSLERLNVLLKGFLDNTSPFSIYNPKLEVAS